MANAKARALRVTLTDAERRLWAHLRKQQIDGHRFRRQVPIGPYVVDFARLGARLLIEVDGGQHAENADADAQRTAWLRERGYDLLRFWNNDVLSNTGGVVETVRAKLIALTTPHPDLPPQGGKEKNSEAFPHAFSAKTVPAR